MTECEVLKEMIRLLGRGGKRWIKNAKVRRMPNGEYGYCLVGAYAKAVRGSNWEILGDYNGAANNLPTLVRFIGQEGFLTIGGFNDAKTTDWPKLRRVLGKARKAACDESSN